MIVLRSQKSFNYFYYVILLFSNYFTNIQKTITHNYAKECVKDQCNQKIISAVYFLERNELKKAQEALVYAINVIQNSYMKEEYAEFSNYLLNIVNHIFDSDSKTCIKSLVVIEHRQNHMVLSPQKVRINHIIAPWSKNIWK